MIYLLEDDGGIRELVCYSLIKTGIKAKGFALPSFFWQEMKKEKPELVLLDIMLPEEDGISVLSKMRTNSNYADIPVIVLTAKGTEYDKVIALDKGADDYVTKPFGVMELMARVNAVLRRSKIYAKENIKTYSLGKLHIDTGKRTVTVSDEPVVLTYKEFELLNLLFEHKGNVIGRDRILSEVWGYEFDGENRTVDVHIRTLRQKLGPCADIIETVRGVGYKIGD